MLMPHKITTGQHERIQEAAPEIFHLLKAIAESAEDNPEIVKSIFGSIIVKDAMKIYEKVR